jgi:hypothetical protein
MRNNGHIVGVLVTLVLIGCARSTQATSVEDIAGLWEGNGGFTQFAEDGNWAWEADRSLVETAPYVAGEYWFEDDQLFIVETYHGEQGIANACPDIIGTYNVELLTNNTLKFTAIRDECRPRQNLFAGDPALSLDVEHQRVSE